MSQLDPVADKMRDDRNLEIIRSASLELQGCVVLQTKFLDEHFRPLRVLFEGSEIYKTSPISSELFKAIQGLKELMIKYNLQQQKHPTDFLHLPIITWLRVPNFPKPVELYPGRHSFTSDNEHRLEYKMIKQITFEDIKHLKHATTARGLAQILGSNSEFGVLKTNLKNDSNLAASGLLFCGVDVKFSEAEREQLPDYVNENRYGSCVLSFTVPSMDSPSTKCFILGTKFYIKEHCQAVLLDTLGQSNQYGVIIQDKMDKIHKCDEVVDKTDFKWNLNYEVKYWRDGQWTNPEVVFPHNLQLKECANLKIIFEPHECIKRKMCRECEFWTSKIIKAKKIDRSGTFVSSVDFIKEENDINSKTDLAIFVFSLSIKPPQRQQIRMLQEGQPLFMQEQFLLIEKMWASYEDFYFEFFDN